MNKTASRTTVSLQVENLGCTRAEQSVLIGVDFSLVAGELLLLRGANGSGKSTLLMCLAGVLPHTGSISWDLGPNTQNEIPTSQSMHFIGHLHAIKPELTLRENLEFWAALYNGVTTDIEEAIAQAGLENMGHFSAANLSAGQKHRLALARLILIPRPIWLLDEPSAALDDQGDQWIAELIDTHTSAGGLVIAATHKPIKLSNTAKTRTLVMGAKP